MKKLFTLISFALLFGTVSAQEQGTPANTDAQGTQKKDIQDLYPLSIYDTRIRLKSVNFVKRHADTGKGEILDVQVELESRVPEDNTYSIYVLAGYEGNQVNEAERRLVPYPAWRKNDPKKEAKTLYFTNVMPTPVTALEVWGQETLNKKKAEVEKLHWQGFEAEYPEPTFTETVDYLCKNNAKALGFTLYGETGPTQDKVVQYNYVAQTPEEKKKQVHDTLPKHTYTIYNNKYQTLVTSHHYSQYRPNFLSFNKIAVLVFDPKKQTNSLLFRKFYDISDLKLSR
ncbi:hypothetical protein [Leptospira idonii]|uniref:Uncharacterized protein n=1 Tax=Leptospira idonii TaxID=1193500 RepID=A0A4R9LZL1_9LEPT|nr:hypothetical protein [Leptospira idonii]TGN17600.1 hypothetical protein EHS15_16330 [Leptospira idonii]